MEILRLNSVIVEYDLGGLHDAAQPQLTALADGREGQAAPL